LLDQLFITSHHHSLKLLTNQYPQLRLSDIPPRVVSISRLDAMKNSVVLVVAAAALLPAASARLISRQDESDEAQKVCYPEFEGDGTIPPCIQIEAIERACQPNGTDTIDYQAHAQCMCNGSYFSDWLGCQSCLEVHGFRSERDIAYWERVMSAASEGLCTGTPTAAFQSLFASAQTNTAIPFATTGNTRSSDQFPSETAVSLYFTATGSQGPGRITGTPTAATADETETTEAPSASSTGSEDDDETSSDTQDGRETSTGTTEETSTGPNGAAATQGPGLYMALAGAAVLAAL
jgi:hypothetical protein